MHDFSVDEIRRWGHWQRADAGCARRGEFIARIAGGGAPAAVIEFAIAVRR